MKMKDNLTSNLNCESPAENNIPVPKQTILTYLQYKECKPQNPGLIFDRFAPSLNSSNGLTTWKQGFLQKVVKLSTMADNDLFAAWNLRWSQTVKSASSLTMELATEWRLVAGLGRKGAAEVGFTFHPYGFPILPGSSLKGLARFTGLAALSEKTGLKLSALENLLSCSQPGGEASAKKAWLEGLRKSIRGFDADTQELCEDFIAVFGIQDCAGGAIFFDAIPAKPPVLELDIMNPHYKDYYGGKTPPTNWQKLTPIFFLTVKPQTKFRFAIGWHTPTGGQDSPDRRRLERAMNWLKDGLLYFGAGAKTSAGYGYFMDDTQPTRNPSQSDRVVLPASSTMTAPTIEKTKMEAPPPEEPPQVREGEIAKIQPPYGEIRDLKSGEVFRFDISVLVDKGRTPPKKARVIFKTQGRHVVEVKIK
jgi:CRISPR-associated protein Cmr6